MELQRGYSLSQTQVVEAQAENYDVEYFSNAPESAFGIVDQTWFNARLQAHFDHARDDSAWYALRNALLAAGCRIYLSKTAGFREAKRASWALFENAMACLPNLLLYSSSVIGVQALTLMVCRLFFPLWWSLSIERR